MTGVLLSINAGSSTVKLAGFSAEAVPRQLFRCTVPNDGHAARPIDELKARLAGTAVHAIGHRIVHGGLADPAHRLLTPAVLDELRRAVPFDPIHLPLEIALIEAAQTAFPAVPQAACFDSVFHRDLPAAARLLPIPRRYAEAGIRRLGFHGLSYAFLLGELARTAGGLARGKLVLAHLGSGASMAAVDDGRPIDTTMAFTPTAGLVMGTRPGDLDPGLLVHLARSEGLGPDALDELINRRCGLLGMSETSADMRELLERAGTDVRAVEAVGVFCRQAKKTIGAFAAALGGLDGIVFAGGIGEHAGEVRARICAGLGFLGVELDPLANAASRPVISASTSRVSLRIVATDEELMMAKIVLRLIGDRP